MIAIQLIIAAFFIGKLYQLKTIKELPKWITIFFVVSLILTNTNSNFRDMRKIEALEKLATEIRKSKSEEK